MMDEEDKKNIPYPEEDIAGWVVDFFNSPESPSGDDDINELEAKYSGIGNTSLDAYAYDGKKIYENTISQFKVANASENRMLLKMWHEFSREDAMTRLIEGNMHIVLRLANYYAYFYPEIDEQDLITIGYTGLKSAVEHFDAKKEASFNTYASYWVKQALQRYIIKTSSVVYIPGKKRLELYLLERFLKNNYLPFDRFDRLSKEHVKRITDELKISERTLKSLFNVPCVKQLDLYTTYLSDGERTTSLIEFFKQNLANDSDRRSEEEYQEIRQNLYDAISQLDVREAMIITYRYGLNGEKALTLEEVSLKIKRTRERVRQIECEALKKLRCLLAKIYCEYIQDRTPLYKKSLFDYKVITASQEDLLHLIYEILEGEGIPLSLNEIRQCLKSLYPTHNITDLLLKRILDSNIFSCVPHANGEQSWQLSNDPRLTTGNYTRNASSKEFSPNAMEFEENLDLLLEKAGDLDILYISDFANDVNDEEMADGEESVLESNMSANDDPTEDIIKMFSL